VTPVAWLAVLGALAAVTGVWLIVFRQPLLDTYPAPEQESPEGLTLAAWGKTATGERWNKEADDVQVSALTDARGLATKWGATIGTLLGVFGIVVFAQGPSALTDVPGRAAYVVLAFVLLATLSAVAAIYFAALAEVAAPTKLSPLNGWTLKHLYDKRLPKIFEQLKLSRALALSAAVLVFGAVSVAWLATLHKRDAPSDPQTVLVTFNDGMAACGELKRTDGGLTVGGKKLLRVNQVAMSACPK
jgi:hypothetical protein